MSARANSQWIGRVKALIRDGYGVEDIAVKLACDVACVRTEVAILRDMGELNDLFGRDQCTRPE